MRNISRKTFVSVAAVAVGLIALLFAVILQSWKRSVAAGDYTLESSTPPSSHDRVFVIPKIAGLGASIEDSGWLFGGFKVDVMACPDGRKDEEPDYSASARIGWDENGIGFAVKVSDGTPIESDDDRRPFEGDCVEIIISNARLTRRIYALSPGRDPQHQSPRKVLYNDAGAVSVAPSTVRSNVVNSEGGYEVRTLVPWTDLSELKPSIGEKLSCQIFAINKFDKMQPVVTHAWYPSSAFNRVECAYQVQLGERPSSPVQFGAGAEFQPGLQDIKVDMLAMPKLVGASVKITNNYGRSAVTKTLDVDDWLIRDSMILPAPASNVEKPALEFFLDNVFQLTLPLPARNMQQNKVRNKLRIQFLPNVFVGDKFPSCNWNDPKTANLLFGPSTLKVSFYDSKWNQVDSPIDSGRYGAIVDIALPGGRSTKRFETLFKMPAIVEGRVCNADTAASMLAKLSRESNVQGAMSPYTRDTDIQFLASPSAINDSRSANLLAVMLDSSLAVGVLDRGQVLRAEREWWAGLRAKLYAPVKKDAAIEQFYPQVTSGTDMAKTIRMGTTLEAGMYSSVIKRLDDLCKLNSREVPKEPFTICVVRHGIVFFHRSYREGAESPDRIEVPGLMWSISKIFPSALLLAAQERGTFDIDENIATYVPPFRQRSLAEPITVRKLLAGTAGFTEHWGESMVDLEERLADIAPFLEVGPFIHANTGHELAAKVLEDISGQSIGQLCQRNIFQPLGMSHTKMQTSSNECISTAWDMAIYAQMLINEGAYGKYRFCNSRNFAELRRSIVVSNAGVPQTEGLGVRQFKVLPGQPLVAYGQGAYNSSILYVIPELDMAVTIACPKMGRQLTSPDRLYKCFALLVNRVAITTAEKK